MVKVTGCSGRVLSVSSKIREGIAIFPFSLASTCKLVVIEVCKSVADTVSVPSFISNKKFSRIGSTVLLLNAPLIACNCFSKVLVETINFICMNLRPKNRPKF
ncbi:hypothetical protein D3C86_1741150 [compost metagenome]